MTTFFLPEGFPAHPHSGFDTVTYCIDGGLRHRDSEGIKMAYGDGDVQWMRAGRGVIHEEMWDLKDSDWKHKRIEIFQLWVNLPKASKGLPPAVHHLHGRDIPEVDFGDGVSMRIICGSTSSNDHDSSLPLTGTTPLNAGHINSEGPGTEIAQSPVGIYHINMKNGGSCVHLGIDEDCTMTTYIRRGSLLVKAGDGVEQSEELKHGELVIFRGLSSDAGSMTDSRYERSYGSIGTQTATATATLQAGPNGLDALILVGKPLNEPVLWSGPLVQADEESFSRSARAFNSIGRDGYWDYKMSDEDWEEHCKKLRLQDFISASRGEPL
jgi:redox-sensitive bicupin YhaK (pirin superfamily)